ncbi:MAG: hypothetical protein LW706_15560 [Chitinophagaceae bacterium]|nr:hypothetical protein [Chitinophagaceae bacterium]
MKKQILFFLLTAFQYAANAQNIKAFVGGTLIDGFGGKPAWFVGHACAFDDQRAQ